MTPAPELYTINQLQRQVEILTKQNAELYRQIDEANAHAEAVRKQPRALLMHLTSECAFMNEHIDKALELMSAIGMLARNYNQSDAVSEMLGHLYDIRSGVTRIEAWTQPQSKNGSNGHND